MDFILFTSPLTPPLNSLTKSSLSHKNLILSSLRLKLRLSTPALGRNRSAQLEQLAEQIFLLVEVITIPHDVIAFLGRCQPVIIGEAHAHQLHEVSDGTRCWAPVFEVHFEENVLGEIGIEFQVHALLVVDGEFPDFALVGPLDHFFCVK